ncbi:MAG: asparagine--tRNA ligase [Thermodesulfobacteriota bacterium]
MDQSAEKPWVRISEINGWTGREVTLKGWLYSKRSSGKVRFLMIRDGSGLIQGVMGVKDVTAEIFNRFDDLTQETSIIVTGRVRADARAVGGFELSPVTGLEIVHQAAEYPISPKEHGPDFLLRHRHLWLRSSRQTAIMKVRAEIIGAIRDYFDRHGYLPLDAPILTPAACENTTTLFATQYFEHGYAYLTQSGQLYAEAGALALGRVYTFGPTFRAEKSKTRRHLTEFWMIEPEVAFAELEDLIVLAEELIEAIVVRVLEKRRPELEVLERDPAPLEKVVRPFVRLTYTQALEILESLGGSPQWGLDLGAPDETMLGEHYDRPVMITHYPVGTKAFYMKPDPRDPRCSLCLDVLAPEGYGEIIGGSQREDDLTALEKRMEKEGIPKEPLEWYLDLRRYGSAPHSGFGLGLERVVAWLCGLRHVREAIPFPRLMDRFYP